LIYISYIYLFIYLFPLIFPTTGLFSNKYSFKLATSFVVDSLVFGRNFSTSEVRMTSNVPKEQ
jgi:hypothetical protein